MRLLIIFLMVFLFSCSSQRRGDKNNNINSQSLNEKKLELNIINSFLQIELKKDKYVRYKDVEIVIIEEPIKKEKSISDYEFNFNNKNSWGKFIKKWTLDSLQIKNLQSDLLNHKAYVWKVTDFDKIKVKILKYEEFSRIIKTNTFNSDFEKIMIKISNPLIINKSNALLSFEINNCKMVCNRISSFTVMMQKKKWNMGTKSLF